MRHDGCGGRRRVTYDPSAHLARTPAEDTMEKAKDAVAEFGKVMQKLIDSLSEKDRNNFLYR